MRNLFAGSLIGAAASLLTAASAFAQTPSKVPDLNGVWQAPYTNNLARPYGKELPMTADGLKHFEANKALQEGNDPSSFCLPVGPARIIQAPMPFQIIQTPQVTSLNFEYQRAFRLVYTDGRPHPGPNDWDVEWYGHSIGHYENGDTLVVDTTYINPRSWLDTAGHEHTADLHLVERFQKKDDKTINWTVTFEDPKYYTQPFTITLPLTRQNTNLMSYSCEENEIDRKGGHINSASR